MQMQTTIKFVTEDSKNNYTKIVLGWLHNDFIQQGQPKNHFYHNAQTIKAAFDKGNALVAFDANIPNEFVGYMIWSKDKDSGTAEIDIVEIKEKYRRQGIFKKILAEFSKKFPDVAVLTASVLEQSEEKFSNAGWKETLTFNQQKKYYKIIKPGLESFNTLQDGCVIAVCPEDFYQVKQNRDRYKPATKFFRIYLDEHVKLSQPIITDFKISSFDYAGYIGIYLNQKLIAEGKAKHLFKNRVCHANLLVLNNFAPDNPTLFIDFIAQAQHDYEHQIITSPAHTTNNTLVTNVETEEKSTEKRKRDEKEMTTDEKLLPPKAKQSKYIDTTISTTMFFTSPEEATKDVSKNTIQHVSYSSKHGI